MRCLSEHSKNYDIIQVTEALTGHTRPFSQSQQAHDSAFPKICTCNIQAQRAFLVARTMPAKGDDNRINSCSMGAGASRGHQMGGTNGSTRAVAFRSAGERGAGPGSCRAVACAAAGSAHLPQPHRLPSPAAPCAQSARSCSSGEFSYQPEQKAMQKLWGKKCW